MVPGAMKATPDEIEQACEQLRPDYDGDGRPPTGRQELADHCGVNARTVDRWRSGEYECTGLAAARVVRLLYGGAEVIARMEERGDV